MILTKSKAAFLLSVDRLFAAKKSRAYMWTFTTAAVVDDSVAFKSWNHLRVLLVREFAKAGSTLQGLRVVEVHPGTDLRPSHGVHFHCVFAVRMPVQVVRRLAIRAGFGRIHVVRVRKIEDVAYLAKYLGKQTDGLKKGTRRWGFIGSFKGSRVRDIRVESMLAENCRRVRAVAGCWGQSLFVAVNILTAKYGHCLEWPDFPALAPRLRRHHARLEDRGRGRDKLGALVEFSWVRIFSEEVAEYVSVLIPTAAALKEYPF